MFNAYLISTLKFQFERNDEINDITSAMYNAYLISTLKFEKNKYLLEIQKNLKKKWKKLKKSLKNLKFLKDLKTKKNKFNNIISAMFNAY